MKNFWEKIKDFFSRIWHGLTTAGRIILGLIIVGLIALTAFALTDNKEEDKQENTPEVAQVYEPSIGTPLPPDVNQEGVTGNVGGATTTEPSSPTTSFVAPDAGIDDDKPMKYSNESLAFASIIPAYSQAIEESDAVMFTSREGTLHYIVSVNDAGNESIEGIESQLRNSTSASNISYTSIANLKALKFNSREHGTGIAFIANGKIYYLLGNSKYFAEFKLL